MLGTLVLGALLSASPACEKGNVTACYFECLGASPSACARMSEIMAEGKAAGYEYELTCPGNQPRACNVVARWVPKAQTQDGRVSYYGFGGSRGPTTGIHHRRPHSLQSPWRSYQRFE